MFLNGNWESFCLQGWPPAISGDPRLCLYVINTKVAKTTFLYCPSFANAYGKIRSFVGLTPWHFLTWLVFYKHLIYKCIDTYFWKVWWKRNWLTSFFPFVLSSCKFNQFGKAFRYLLISSSLAHEALNIRDGRPASSLSTKPNKTQNFISKHWRCKHL